MVLHIFRQLPGGFFSYVWIGDSLIVSLESSTSAGRQASFYAFLVQGGPLFFLLSERQPSLKPLLRFFRSASHRSGCLHYFSKLVPMSASFLADTELLEQYRAKMSQMQAAGASQGPQKIEDLLATYLDEEKQLGRLQPHVSSRALAALFLGACFQFTYFHQLMGNTPTRQTEDQFAAELIRGLLSSFAPV